MQSYKTPICDSRKCKTEQTWWDDDLPKALATSPGQLQPPSCRERERERERMTQSVLQYDFRHHFSNIPPALDN